MNNDFIINAKKVKQNNLEFFLGIYTIKQILSFTKYTERLITAFDEDNIPIYNPQIQRKAENSRVEKIADFLLDDPDALFPTNLVISIPNAAIEKLEETESAEVKIELSSKVFSEVKKLEGDIYLTIIDGQHRIKGIERAIERIKVDIQSLKQILLKSRKEEIQKDLERYNRKLSNLVNISLGVSFFIDPTLEFQAMVFSTINRTQKSVPQSLVYSLFGLTESDSPQKSALQIVLALNSFKNSPFFDRIKLHGGTYGRNQSPPLTQATMVKSIINLISANLRDSERDRFRSRKDLIKNINPDLPFRRYYANNQDTFIIDILYSFFSAVKETFVIGEDVLWNFREDTKPTNILQTTVGYQALLMILVDILKIETDDEVRDKPETYKFYLKDAIALDLKDTNRYPFTSISKTIFYLDLSLNVWPSTNPSDDRRSRLREVLRS